MAQTVGRSFTFEELAHALVISMDSFPNPNSFEEQAYFEGTYPIEATSDPEGLIKKFSDIEGRLANCIDEPVVCVRDGNILLLYMGFVKSPKVTFQFDQNSELPRGSASIEVDQLSIAAIAFDDRGGVDVEMLPSGNGGGGSYFHFEEREFRANSNIPSSYKCISTDWDLLIGSKEIEQFFGRSRLILPIHQGQSVDANATSIETTAVETVNPEVRGR